MALVESNTGLKGQRIQCMVGQGGNSRVEGRGGLDQGCIDRRADRGGSPEEAD